VTTPATTPANIYRLQFVSHCPNNGLHIIYSLEIETAEVIHVEHIVTATSLLANSFHEDIADELHDRFGGKQTLRAHHHGVDIETRRGFPEESGLVELAHISTAHRRILESGVSVVAQIGPRTSDKDVQLYVKEPA